MLGGGSIKTLPPSPSPLPPSTFAPSVSRQGCPFDLARVRLQKSKVDLLDHLARKIRVLFHCYFAYQVRREGSHREWQWYLVSTCI